MARLSMNIFHGFLLYICKQNLKAVQAHRQSKEMDPMVFVSPLLKPILLSNVKIINGH